MLPKVCDSVHL